MTDTYGPKSSEPFAYYDLDGSCWRTSQGTFPWGSTEYSATWPRRGSMQNGVCCEHPTWEPPTGAPESSSLLPTPTANQPGGTAEQMLARKQAMVDGPRSTVTDLRMVVELLPTPSASDHHGKRGAGSINRGNHYTSLSNLWHLLPTPVVTDAKAARNRAANRAHPQTNHNGETLMDLFGAPTPPPSNDGNTPSDGQLHLLFTPPTRNS